MEGPKYYRYEDYPEYMIRAWQEGIEEPTSNVMMLWVGSTVLDADTFIPMTPVVIYTDDKYYGGTYDVESARDCLAQTGKMILVIGVFGELQVNQYIFTNRSDIG